MRRVGPTTSRSKIEELEQKKKKKKMIELFASGVCIQCFSRTLIRSDWPVRQFGGTLRPTSPNILGITYSLVENRLNEFREGAEPRCRERSQQEWRVPFPMWNYSSVSLACHYPSPEALRAKHTLRIRVPSNFPQDATFLQLRSFFSFLFFLFFPLFSPPS